jgi:hypothetical protein
MEGIIFRWFLFVLKLQLRSEQKLVSIRYVRLNELVIRIVAIEYIHNINSRFKYYLI